MLQTIRRTQLNSQTSLNGYVLNFKAYPNVLALSDTLSKYCNLFI